MIRVILHKLNDGFVRVRTKDGYERYFLIRDDYRMVIALREVYRDLLYARYGDRYRYAYAHHWGDIARSIVSAVRRMR
jgi:hypothetical protein